MDVGDVARPDPVRRGHVELPVKQIGRNRQIVVARLENEVTVKRYKQEGSTVWLMPENPDFEPIRVNMKDPRQKEEPLIIEGVVVGVLRRGKAAASGLM